MEAFIMNSTIEELITGKHAFLQAVIKLTREMQEDLLTFG